MADISSLDELREVAPRRPLRKKKKKTGESSPSEGSRDSKQSGSKTRSSFKIILLWIVLSVVVALLAIVAWNFVQQYHHQTTESAYATVEETAKSKDTPPPVKSPSPQKRKASKYCKTPIFGAQEVYDRVKSHITKPEEFGLCLKLTSNVVSDIIKTHEEEAALEAVILKWAEDEKKACWENIVRALGCMKNTALAVQIAVEYGFGSAK